MSRSLGTTHKGRAIGFWRDVLGFDVRGSDADGRIDLVSGARVRLAERDWPPDFSGEGERPDPPSSSSKPTISKGCSRQSGAAEERRATSRR